MVTCGGISSTPKGRLSQAPITSLERLWSCMSALTTSAWTRGALPPPALHILGTQRNTAPPASESPAVRSGSSGLTGSSRKTISEVAVSLPSLVTMLTSSLSTSTASSSARSQRGSRATQASSTRTDQVSSHTPSRCHEGRCILQCTWLSLETRHRRLAADLKPKSVRSDRCLEDCELKLRSTSKFFRLNHCSCN